MVLTEKYLAASRQRIKRAKEKREFHTSVVTWSYKERHQKNRYNQLLKQTVKTITTKYMFDNLKASYGNKPKSALLSKAAFDLYFGDTAKLLSDDETVDRMTYGSFSGSASIGLDPKGKMVHPMFQELSDLRRVVRQKTIQHYMDKDGELLFDCDYNAASGKVYNGEQTVGGHTDMQFDNQHQKPLETNSQKPNTPVAICSYGDDKYLHFKKYAGGGSGHKVIPLHTLTFLQKSGMLIILDPRDEYFNQKMQYWKHCSELADNEDGVCITIMFRVLKYSAPVFKSTGCGVDPKIPPKGKKQRKFDAMRKRLSGQTRAAAEYKQKRAAALAKIQARLSKY